LNARDTFVPAGIRELMYEINLPRAGMWIKLRLAWPPDHRRVAGKTARV